MTTIKLGINAKLYRGVAGTALRLMTEVPEVKDVAIALSVSKADVTTRANQGWKATQSTLKPVVVAFEMPWVANLGFIALRDAWKVGSLLELAVMDGPWFEIGTEGPKGRFTIVEFSRDEKNDGAVVAQVSAELQEIDEWIDGALGISALPAVLPVVEGATANIVVRLTKHPLVNKVVATAWASGDADLTVQSGAALTFTPTNFDTSQNVVIAAADDNDQGSAVFDLSCAGLVTQHVTANDVAN